MVEVVRLQNANALTSPEFVKFLTRSVKKGSMVDAKSLILGLPAHLADPHFVALVGVEDGAFKGLSLISLPSDLWQLVPFIIHFYNDGSATLRKMLAKITVDFVIQAGYTSFMSANMSGKSSDVLFKIYKKVATGRVIGEMMEFKVG